MTITIIHGQTHKGSTYHITDKIKENISQTDTVVHEFFMPDAQPDICKGCFQCIVRGETFCPHYDTMKPIIAAMEDSDIIMVDSPTYCMEMTGALKVFFDHLAYLWLPHRPSQKMFRKIGVSISTAAGSGAGGVSKSIARQLFWIGVTKNYKVHYNVGAMSWDQVDEKTRTQISRQAKVLARKILKQQNRKNRPIGFKMKFMFGLMRLNQKGNTWNSTDRGHWEQHGWLGKERPWKTR